MNRSLTALVGVCLLVLAGIGYGTLTTPSSTRQTAADTRLPIQSTSLVCPRLEGNNADLSTELTALSPVARSGANLGSASVSALGSGGKNLLQITKPGVLASSEVKSVSSNNPVAVGNAAGPLASGFSVGETVSDSSGPKRGLAGTTCQQTGTQFWFVGASGASNAYSDLYVVNSQQTPAQFNVQLYGPNGQITTSSANGLVLNPGQSQDILLSTLMNGSQASVLGVHVTATEGSISAALLDTEAGGNGTDFVPAQTAPASHLVIPGVPTRNPSKLRLDLFTTSSTDVTVNLHWIGHSTIVPERHSQVVAKAGQVTSVDLTDVPSSGEAGALQLDATDGSVLAGMFMVDSDSYGQDVAFLGPATPLTGDAVVTDNRSGSSGSSTLLLSAPKQTAQVTVSTVSSSAPRTSRVTVPGGSTVAVPLSSPGGDEYAAVVTPVSGGPVYAARVLTEESGGPLVTVQELTTARETVLMPNVAADLSGMVPQRR